ncbi:MAG: helix-turn-helix domain-containing protein [Candidatus Magasanikbacteria bacterium]
MSEPINNSKEIIRVSISEAARLFGVNPQTIRRAIKGQEITYVVVAGRYKINFESLVNWSQKKITVKNKAEKYGIGQYVDKWKIKNTLYSPSKKSIKKKPKEESTNNPETQTSA